MDLKEVAEKIFKQTLTRVKPEKMIPEMVQYHNQTETVTINNTSFQLDKSQPLYIIGTGKAAASMSSALESIFEDRISGGFIIIPPGAEKNLKHIKVAVGSHPIPDKFSFTASEQLKQFAESIPKGAFVINVLSGGTSALFASPVESIPEEQISILFKLLVESGASIDEINSVRPTVSSVKAGKFLQYLSQTTLVDLIISDIPNDDLKFVGSGPTTAQQISFQKSIQILKKYKLWEKIPSEIQSYLEEKFKSTPSIQTEDFESHFQFLISSATLVAKDANEIANDLGFTTKINSPAWTGSIERYVEKIRREIDSQIKNKSNMSGLIFFGEPTVKVTGKGLGGRNQELVLRMAKVLPDFKKNISFLSCGTDGIDGPTDVAGAVADQNLSKYSKELGLEIDVYLKENDSYHFFKKAGGHIKTGPTGNNVMDLQIVLWE